MFARHLLLRGLLVFISIYHILAGLLVNTTELNVLWTAKNLAGVTMEPNPQLLYIAKPFGVYLICFGVLAGLAAWNPIKNRSFISVAVALCLVRAAQRFIFANDFESLFHSPHGRNMLGAGFVTFLAVALLILRLRLHADIKKNGLPSAETTGV